MTEQGKWFTISKLEQSENGLLPRTWLSRLANTCCIQTPSIAVRRSVYEHLGGFDQRLYTTEDWEMWVRIACHYPIGYVAEPLAIYRQHSASFSRRNIRDGTHFRNLRQTIALFQSYLPADVVATSRGQVWRDYACYALSYADTFIRHSDFTAAIVLIRQALFMSRSLVVLKWIIRMLLVDIPYHWLKTWFKTRLKTLRSEEICP